MEEMEVMEESKPAAVVAGLPWGAEGAELPEGVARHRHQRQPAARLPEALHPAQSPAPAQERHRGASSGDR